MTQLHTVHLCWLVMDICNVKGKYLFYHMFFRLHGLFSSSNCWSTCSLAGVDWSWICHYLALSNVILFALVYFAMSLPSTFVTASYFMMFLPLSYKSNALLIIQFDRFDFCSLFVYFLLLTWEVRVTYYLGSYHHVFAFYSHEPTFRVIFAYLTSRIFKLFQSS